MLLNLEMHASVQYSTVVILKVENTVRNEKLADICCRFPDGAMEQLFKQPLSTMIKRLLCAGHTTRFNAHKLEAFQCSNSGSYCTGRSRPSWDVLCNSTVCTAGDLMRIGFVRLQ
jgi:hypothetical protein